MRDYNKDGIDDKQQIEAWVKAKPWVALAVGLGLGILAGIFFF